MARSNFSFEKRRKEVEKKKKRAAKREARADRKSTGDEGGAPIAELDEWGNVIEVEADDVEEAAADESAESGEKE